MDHSRRDSGRPVPIAFVALGLLLSAIACAPHPPGMRVIDQQNLGATAITDYVDRYHCNATTWSSEVGQTFTAGRTGLLDQVSLNARPISATSSPLVVDIVTLRPDGAPGDLVVGTGSYTGPGSPPSSSVVVEIPLSQPAHVVAGHRYAIVVGVAPIEACPSTSIHGWYVAGTADLYANGELSSRGNLYDLPDWEPDNGGANDLTFITWVRSA